MTFTPSLNSIGIAAYCLGHEAGIEMREVAFH